MRWPVRNCSSPKRYTRGSEMVKRLYRSRENKIIGGVMGGIGEYLDVDPVAVRAAYVIAALLSGIMPLLIAYIILLSIIPVGVVNSASPA